MGRTTEASTPTSEAEVTEDTGESASMNKDTAAAMGDAIFSLDQLSELVETVFDSVDEDLLEGNANKARIKYTGAISEFINHPITESYLGQGGA